MMAPPESCMHSALISDIVETGWEAQTDVGLWRREFDPVSGRRTRFFSTSSVLSWMGVDAEEFAAKMGRRELPVFLTQFELVARVCDNIVNGHKPLSSRVYRYRVAPGRCLFVHVSTSRVFDSLGRLLRLEEIIRPLSVAEMNEVMERDPGSVCITHMGSKPSYSDAGTRVDAETLQASVDADFKRGRIAYMMKQAPGRALVESLLHKFAAAAAPIMKVADKILEERGEPALRGDMLHFRAFEMM